MLKGLEKLKGKRALVTGASGGIGLAFAQLLAANGANLVLVARSERNLEAVKDKLVGDYGCSVEIIPADLSEPAAAPALCQTLAYRKITVDILINNAGVGLHGSFVDQNWEDIESLVALDIQALLHLSWHFARDMIARGAEGYILQLSSGTAFQPSPKYAVYGAAKAMVQHFGETLAIELEGSSVHCSVLTPGSTKSNFFNAAGHQEPGWYLRWTQMRPEEVAELGLRGLLKGKRSIIPGFFNRSCALLARVLPHRLAAYIFTFFVN